MESSMYYLNSLYFGSSVKLPLVNLNSFDCLDKLRKLELININNEVLRILRKKWVEQLEECTITFNFKQKLNVDRYFTEGFYFQFPRTAISRYKREGFTTPGSDDRKKYEIEYFVSNKEKMIEYFAPEDLNLTVDDDNNNMCYFKVTPFTKTEDYLMNKRNNPIIDSLLWLEISSIQRRRKRICCQESFFEHEKEYHTCYQSDYEYWDYFHEYKTEYDEWCAVDDKWYEEYYKCYEKEYEWWEDCDEWWKEYDEWCKGNQKWHQECFKFYKREYEWWEEYSLRTIKWHKEYDQWYAWDYNWCSEYYYWYKDYHNCNKEYYEWCLGDFNLWTEYYKWYKKYYTDPEEWSNYVSKPSTIKRQTITESFATRPSDDRKSYYISLEELNKKMIEYFEPRYLNPTVDDINNNMFYFKMTPITKTEDFLINRRDNSIIPSSLLQDILIAQAEKRKEAARDRKFRCERWDYDDACEREYDEWCLWDEEWCIEYFFLYREDDELWNFDDECEKVYSKFYEEYDELWDEYDLLKDFADWYIGNQEWYKEYYKCYKRDDEWWEDCDNWEKDYDEWRAGDQEWCKEYFNCYKRKYEWWEMCNDWQNEYNNWIHQYHKWIREYEDWYREYYKYNKKYGEYCKKDCRLCKEIYVGHSPFRNYLSMASGQFHKHYKWLRDYDNWYRRYKSYKKHRYNTFANEYDEWYDENGEDTDEDDEEDYFPFSTKGHFYS
ncbi:unnamed protein product [Diamesa tonsa]